LDKNLPDQLRLVEAPRRAVFDSNLHCRDSQRRIPRQKHHKYLLMAQTKLRFVPIDVYPYLLGGLFEISLR
jgi:hypothetical protein